MIKYSLCCDADHEFEGWFRDSADFDRQAEKKLIECPTCGSSNVRKGVMAPAIARARSADRSQRLAEIRENIAEAVARARNFVKNNYDYVGDDFADEARKIHYGEGDQRGIYGEASKDDVHELIDEGIDVVPMPAEPELVDTHEAGPAKIADAAPVDKKLN